MLFHEDGIIGYSLHLYTGGQHVHADNILGSHTGPLDNELLVSQLHSVEASDGLVCDGVVQILGKCVALGQAGGGVLHQVEGLQLAEAGQQLLDLLVIEIVGQSGHKQLVGAVRHHGGDHAGDSTKRVA